MFYLCYMVLVCRLVINCAAKTGMGHWLIGLDIFPELQLGWKSDEATHTSTQNLEVDNSANRLSNVVS